VDLTHACDLLSKLAMISTSKLVSPKIEPSHYITLAFFQNNWLEMSRFWPFWPRADGPLRGTIVSIA
jgi:hypothetical protein